MVDSIVLHLQPVKPHVRFKALQDNVDVFVCMKGLSQLALMLIIRVIASMRNLMQF